MMAVNNSVKYEVNWLKSIGVISENSNLPYNFNLAMCPKTFTQVNQGQCNLYLGWYGVMEPNCVMVLNICIKYEANWMNSIGL